MKSGTTSGSQIPKPIEYKHALPSATQSGGNQASTAAHSPEKQPRGQITEPLRSSGATYVPASAGSSSDKENSGARTAAAMNLPYPANVVVTAGADEEKVPGIAVDAAEVAIEVVQLVRKQARVLHA
ncbi:hypothetical protein N0V84_008335 [Fusarium piperis]|uniref:Uncharacterized protein n=1 Tax=Fusarium piperis TaxID=1435070 RepID=A0A9W8W8C9_9HYPO|nr:hypothetical protein N0V84_008335 [Fusarium piperis]